MKTVYQIPNKSFGYLFLFSIFSSSPSFCSIFKQSSNIFVVSYEGHVVDFLKKTWRNEEKCAVFKAMNHDDSYAKDVLVNSIFRVFQDESYLFLGFLRFFLYYGTTIFINVNHPRFVRKFILGDVIYFSVILFYQFSNNFI